VEEETKQELNKTIVKCNSRMLALLDFIADDDDDDDDEPDVESAYLELEWLVNIMGTVGEMLK
jgi:hypothetical protein